MMKKKGGIFVGMIMMFVIYLFAIGIVVVFFYFFKFHITITVLDEYRWNKIQEVPLSLFSMDVDGEPFVSGANKIIYGFEAKSELDEIKERVNDQLYFAFGDVPPNMGYILTIGEVTVSESRFPDCDCKLTGLAWGCTNDCAPDKRGKPCGQYEPELCFDIGRREYSASYPFPLAFNGTTKFIDGLSYDAVDYK